MKKTLTVALGLLVAASGAALADHNSKWGEGTALDPTGMHDARIDSLDTAGDEPFGSAPEETGGRLVDIFAFLRQGRPDTIEIDAGGSSDTERGGMSGSSAGGGGSGNGHGGGRN